MNDMFKKLMLKKKSDEPMDEDYKNAKMTMLEALKGHMGKMMGDDLKNGAVKKVSVIADDKEGLASGLDKAKELVKKSPLDMSPEEHMGQEAPEDDAEDASDESEESPQEEEDELSKMELSVDEIEKMEQILAKKKQELLAKG